MPGRLRSRSLVTLAWIALVAACGGGSSGVAPVLTSLDPGSGTVGTVVAIAGASFQQSGTGSSAVSPTVTFTPAGGGQSFTATVTSFSATELEVAVPAVALQLAADGTTFDVTVANPGAGSATLRSAFRMSLPTIVAVNGGLVGSGTAGSLFILDGKGFGDLGAPPASGYPFSLDFRDPSSGAATTATVDFVAGNWQDIFIVATVPALPASATPYQLTVTTPSGTSAPASFLVVAAVSFSPSTIAWSATSPLPVAQQGFPALVAPVGSSTFAYVLGGNTATPSTAQGKAQNLATVSFAPLDAATGAIGAAWTATTPLPQPRGFAMGVAANAFNSLVPGNGNLYVLGGLDGAGAPVASVYSARIQADGTLDPWTTLPALPTAVAYHQLVTSAGYLYVLGGDATAVDPVTNASSASEQDAIYSQPINIRNGALANATWKTNPNLLAPKAREKFSAVVAGSYVLVSGGLYGTSTSTGSSEQSYAAIATDGSVGTFNGATGSHTISGSPSGYSFFNHASAYFVDTSGKPHVLILGGQDVTTGALHDGVWYQH